MLCEHEHELVVDANRLRYLGSDLIADLEILSVEPTANPFCLKIREQTLGERLVLGTVTYEAGVELDRVHRADQGGQVIDQGFGHATPAEECLRNSLSGPD